MEDKIINALINYAKKDKITGLHITYYAQEMLHQYNYGYTNEHENISINNDTLFEIGSITKPIIAILYAIMNSNNKIDIDKPISHYIDDTLLHPIFNLVTIKDVLAHKSGLPRLSDLFIKKMSENIQDPYVSLEINDLYSFLKNPDEFYKYEKYRYSNIGYGILGEILKKISDKSLFEISSELLFDKLGMARTNVIENLSQDTNVASGYTLSGKLNEYWHNTILSGAGCFLSCGNDMSKLLMANIHAENSAISRAIHYTHIPITNKAGMAWHYKNSLFAKLLGYYGYIWHNGMTGGFSSFICFNKKKKTGLLLLANKAISLDSYFYRFSSYF